MAKTFLNSDGPIMEDGGIDPNSPWAQNRIPSAPPCTAYRLNITECIIRGREMIVYDERNMVRPAQYIDYVVPGLREIEEVNFGLTRRLRYLDLEEGNRLLNEHIRWMQIKLDVANKQLKEIESERISDDEIEAVLKVRDDEAIERLLQGQTEQGRFKEEMQEVPESVYAGVATQ